MQRALLERLDAVRGHAIALLEVADLGCVGNGCHLVSWPARAVAGLQNVAIRRPAGGTWPRRMRSGPGVDGRISAPSRRGSGSPLGGSRPGPEGSPTPATA